MNSIGKFPSLLFESAHSPTCLNNQPLNCMLFTCARMSSSSVFSFHTLSSPGARQTTECEWFAKRKSWRRAQGVDHSPCARGTQKRLEPLRHTCYHGVWRASTVGTHPAALTRQSYCSYAAGGADTEQQLPKEWSQPGWIRTRTPKRQKGILGCILYICFAIPTQPYELACVSERCAVQLGVTLEAGKAYLAEPGLSVLTRSYDGLYSHHGPSSGD